MSIPLSSAPRDICLIRLSAIGDTCHVVPVLRTLQQQWPAARIVWVIGKLEASLMAGMDGVEFIIFDKSRGLAAYSDLHRALGDRRFDLLLCMHASLRANLASRVIRARVRLGFDRERARDFQWLVTSRRIEARPCQHVLDGLFGFPRALGIEQRCMRWDIPLSQADQDFARRLLPETGRPWLAISPCSSQRFRNYRNWRAEYYAEVCDYVSARYGAGVVLTGGASRLEREYAEQIARRSSARLVDLVGGTSLKQLLAVLQRADVLLCPDSGPAHMATAVGTAVVGLYATSNRLRTGPYFCQHLVVDRYPQAVRLEFGKSVEEVPWGARVRDPGAMDLIEPAAVKDMLDRVLAAGEGPSGP